MGLLGWLFGRKKGAANATTKTAQKGREGIDSATPNMPRKDLHKAAEAGDSTTVEEWLAEGVDPDKNDSEGRTPLHLAAAAGRTDVVKVLLDRGADVNAKTFTGVSPLHWAVSGGHTEAAELLLDCGADANAKTDKGHTPLRFAVHTKQLGIGRLLLDYGADPDIRDAFGAHPLRDWAAGDPKTQKKLLGYHPKPRARTKGDTAPDKASRQAPMPGEQKGAPSATAGRVKRACEYKEGERVVFTLDTFFPTNEMGILSHVNVGSEAVVVEAPQAGASSEKLRLSIPGLGVRGIHEKCIDDARSPAADAFRHVQGDWVPCRYDPERYGWIMPGMLVGGKHRFQLKDGTVLEGEIEKQSGDREFTVSARAVSTDDIAMVWFEPLTWATVWRVPE